MKPLTYAPLLALTALLIGCGSSSTAEKSMSEAQPNPQSESQSGAVAQENPFGIAAGDGLRWLADPVPEKRAELARQLDGMQALGIGWVRLDFPWSAVQAVSKKQFYWNGLDVVVDGITGRDMQVLGILDYTPEWARSAGCQSFACPPANVDDFAAYAKAAATRYASKGVHTWEIWNEPNLSGFWGSTPDPVKYTQMVVAATKAIKAVDPSATVIVGALGYNGTEDGNMHPVDFLNSMYEAAPEGFQFDAVSYHAYSYPMMPTAQASNNGWTMMDAGSHSVYQVMKDHGDGDKKIWITEYGAPALSQQLSEQGVSSASRWMVTEKKQAQMMQDALNAIEGSTHIAKFFWYSYKDLGVDPDSLENFFGLTDFYGNHKPAYDTYQQLIAQYRQQASEPQADAAPNLTAPNSTAPDLAISAFHKRGPEN